MYAGLFHCQKIFFLMLLALILGSFSFAGQGIAKPEKIDVKARVLSCKKKTSNFCQVEIQLVDYHKRQGLNVPGDKWERNFYKNWFPNLKDRNLSAEVQLFSNREFKFETDVSKYRGLSRIFQGKILKVLANRDHTLKVWVYGKWKIVESDIQSIRVNKDWFRGLIYKGVKRPVVILPKSNGLKF